MLNRLFPKQFDNTYTGWRLALWLFVLVMAAKGLQATESILNTREVAVNADGIPLDSFPPAAATEVLSIFAVLGIYLLILPLQSVIVMLRYRAMVPFMYLCMIVLQLSIRLLHLFRDTPPSGALDHPVGFYVNIAILTVTVVGFVLSLLPRKTVSHAAAGA